MTELGLQLGLSLSDQVRANLRGLSRYDWLVEPTVFSVLANQYEYSLFSLYKGGAIHAYSLFLQPLF